MRKKKRLLWLIPAVLVLALAVAAITQWNTILSVLSFMRYSEDELKAQLAEDNQVIQAAIEKITSSVTDLSEEDKQQLISGQLSQEDAIAKILADSQNTLEDSPAENPSSLPAASPAAGAAASPAAGAAASPTAAAPSPTGTASPSPSPVKSEDEKRIDELIATLYVLRTVYSSLLDNLINGAAAEYNALPAEQKSAASKQSFFTKYIGQATNLESECDVKVYTITSEIRTLLKKTGGDLTVVDDILSTYNSEKSTKKAYYMSMYSSS